MAHTAQQAAFIHEIKTGTSNVALMARAGTGKTYTLVEACKAMPSNDKVLALAFNKSIADVLNERLPPHAKAQTLNSLGHRAWQRHIGTKKLVLNTDKLGAILKPICKEQPELWSHWAAIATLINKARLHGLVPNGAPGKYEAFMQDTDENWLSLMTEYDIDLPALSDGFALPRQVLLQMIKKAMDGEIDFDDQIYMTTVWNVRCDRFDAILVDEAQDLSDMQHRFLSKMMDDSTRLIVVGDDKQAIYGFRGSLSNSLPKLIGEYACKTFPLTVSFRCSKSVIRAAQAVVPDIAHLPDAPEGEVTSISEWNADTIESKGTILCRNVAPLVRTTYRLIAGGRPAVMVGRDIGKGLINLVKSIIKPASNMGTSAFLDHLEDWLANEIEIARSKGQPWKEEKVQDQYDSILAVQSFSRAVDTAGLIAGIEKLFATASDNKITLCTIHRSKGLEWDTVYFLDSFRCPSKFARKALAEGKPGAEEQMQQEMNLMYVAITRAKHKLIYINSDKFVGSAGAYDPTEIGGQESEG